MPSFLRSSVYPATISWLPIVAQAVGRLKTELDSLSRVAGGHEPVVPAVPAVDRPEGTFVEGEIYSSDLFLLVHHFLPALSAPEFTKKTRLAVIPGSRNSTYGRKVSKNDTARKRRAVLGH